MNTLMNSGHKIKVHVNSFSNKLNYRCVMKNLYYVSTDNPANGPQQLDSCIKYKGSLVYVRFKPLDGCWEIGY